MIIKNEDLYGKETIINIIKEKGWNEETMQLIREALVNQPTGSWNFYDLHKCFYNNVTVDHVIKVLNELRYCNKYSPDAPKKWTEEKKKLVYGNVLTDDNCHRSFDDPEELIEFWNGTSRTRAKAFIDKGDGYSRLEHPVYTTELTQYGIQVMLEDFRAYDYARRQAYYTKDRPCVIHGFIKAKYLFGANNSNEYAIPCEYYMHIQDVELL